jgi:hypothetical protein
MIVRKYRERKRGKEEIFGKEKNKKELMDEFRSEVERRISTDVGLDRKIVPTKYGPKR